MTALLQDNGTLLEVASYDLLHGEPLLNAVMISLFTDRRAAADDRLPDGEPDRRGWWADAYSARPGQLIGSRLWLLGKDPLSKTSQARAEHYAREALHWLVDAGQVQAVETAATVIRGVLWLTVGLRLGVNNVINYKFTNVGTR